MFDCQCVSPRYKKTSLLFRPKFLEVLKQDTFVFDDIRNLLDGQFKRLSNLEKEVMYWLAINREPVTLPELQADFVCNVSSIVIIEALASLQRRSLIQKSVDGFTQQPVVMEYITSQLIERVCTEITTPKIALFRRHALIQATAKEYIRDTQIRLILQPVIKELINKFKSKNSTETRLAQILSILQDHSPLKARYAGGNVLNLLCQLKTNLDKSSPPALFAHWGSAFSTELSFTPKVSCKGVLCGYAFTTCR